MSRSSTPGPCTPGSSPQKRGLLTPIVLSPAESVSPSPDAQDGSSIFDFSFSISPSEATTPLTPPESKASSQDKLPDVADSPLLRKSTKAPAYADDSEPSEKQTSIAPLIFEYDKTKIKEEHDKIAAPGQFNPNPNNFSFSASKSASKRASKPRAPSSSAEPQSVDSSSSKKAKKAKSKETTKKSKELRKALEQIIPKSIYQRISESKTICVGSIVRKQTQRCSKPIEGSGAALEALQSLAKAIKEKKSAEILMSVNDIISSAMCYSHDRTAKAEKTYSMLENLLKGLADELNPLSSIEVDEYNTWTKAISSQGIEATAAPKAPKIEVTEPSQAPSPKVEKPASSTPPEARHGETNSSVRALPRFEKYRPKYLTKLSVDSALKKAASAPLGKRDMERGCIYMFWDEGSFGYVKVGYSIDPNKRLEQWNKKCGRDHVFQNSIERVEVQHVYRLERLIHTEMNMQQMRMKCDGCGKTHREWFCVSQDHAVAVFEKWKTWILQSPYEEDQTTQQWRLSSVFTKTLEEVCKPVDIKPMNHPHTPQRPKLIKPTGARFRLHRNHS